VLPRSGVNPLVSCASSLLVAAGQLRHSPSHADPEGLRKRLAGDVREFEACARAQGIQEATVLPARYVLCSLVDEAVLGTPWGSESIWAKQGLLIGFHKEAWGGEKFFQALERLIAYPSGNLQMLELMYLCLAMGFEGRYQVREGGRDQLEAVRERLYQTIRAQRGEPERELSPHWRGVIGRRDPLIHTVPLWVLSAVAGALLLIMFTLFNLSLHQKSEPVFQRVANINVPTVEVPRTAPPTPPVEAAATEPPVPVLTLRKLLSDEIQAGKLEVIDRPGGEMIRIRGDGLFASGRVAVKKDYLPILARIGWALDQLPGRILITGHTDGVPIRSRRFASNQQLSEERAESVRRELTGAVRDSSRIRTKGMGAAELLISGSPADGRNRRVEITLTHAAGLAGALQ
jgi:type VI secretion system protein ImpK